MSGVVRLSSVGMVALLMVICIDAKGQYGARVSPFTEVVVEGDAARVVFQGKRYELVSVEGLGTAEILAYCRKSEPRRWEDRFATDLVEVMNGMGKKVGETVKIALRDPESGENVIVERAPMTAGNRTSVYEALDRRRRATRGEPLRRLTGRQMRAAVDALETALEQRWSYLGPSGFDHRSMLGALRGRVDAGVTPEEFLAELQEVIGRGIDGHAEIRGWDRLGAQEYLPFLIEPGGGRFVAFGTDRKAFLADGFPYIESIDGRPIGEWISAASAYIPEGSPQYVRQHGLKLMRSVQLLRKELGIEPRPTIRVELGSAVGNERRTVEVKVASASPFYGYWPREDDEPPLPKGVAYLRLWDMPGDPLARTLIQTAVSIARQSDARGLIIDARDNGGGARDCLMHLAPLLMDPDSPPRVVNAAAYRLYTEHTARMMESRYLYPEDWRNWSAAERRAIAEFKGKFAPQWKPSRELYSEWHYLVLSPTKERTRRFEKPVAILMNANCFSATDVFLSALKGMENVTLVGTASGGGSANTEEVALGSEFLSARLGTMVSFQADGRFFDTHGVAPDIHVEAEAEFWIGGVDRQLQRAVEVVLKGK